MIEALQNIISQKNFKKEYKYRFISQLVEALRNRTSNDYKDRASKEKTRDEKKPMK